MAKARNY